MPVHKLHRLVLSLAALGVLLPALSWAQGMPGRGPLPPAAFDRDGDGAISQEEFETTRAEHRATMAARGMAMRRAGNMPSFADFDRNGDGRLSPEEMEAGRRMHMQQGRGMGPGYSRGPAYGPGVGHGVPMDPGYGRGPVYGPGAGRNVPMGPGYGMGTGPGMGPGLGMGRGGNRPPFAEFDLDGDGRISEKEFQEGRTRRIQERAQQRYPMRNLPNAPAFQDLDVDGDGVISPQEFNMRRPRPRQQQ